MELYVIADMEGITGCSSYERELYPHCPDYSRARGNLIADTRAALDGARSAGADRFTIYDIHYRGDNLVGADLGSDVTLIAGKPRDGGMRAGQSGVFILGLHAMAGNPNGVLPHSYQHSIERIRFDGREVGEIGMEAFGAGSLGLPVCLVVADEEGCREAEALLPGVVTVATKRLCGEGSVEHYDEAPTRERIHAAAADAAHRTAGFTPLSAPGPATITVRCRDAETARTMAEKMGADVIDDRTARICAASAGEAYERFRRSQTRD